MPKQNNNKKISKSVHSFPGCREAFLTTGPRANPGTVQYAAPTDVNGAGSCAFVVAPLGLTSVTLSGTTFSAPVYGNVYGPTLRGMFNKCTDFQWYRVTRAKFVFVGAYGSTVTGNITLVAYSDPIDISVSTGANYLSGPNTRTFDIANAAGKELSVPVPVDTSWKKCSSILTCASNAYPFVGATASGFVPVSTVADLACAGVAASWNGFSTGGAPVSTGNMGSFYLDYDLELKGVIDSSANI